MGKMNDRRKKPEVNEEGERKPMEFKIENVMSCFIQDPSHSCPRCGKGFTSKRWMLNHSANACQLFIDRKRDEAWRKFPCRLCEARFFEKHHLAAHENSYHNDDKNHVCEDCGKSFSWKSSFNRHRQRECGQNSDFTCETCLASFPTKHGLLLHLSESKHSQNDFINDPSVKMGTKRDITDAGYSKPEIRKSQRIKRKSIKFKDQDP